MRRSFLFTTSLLLTLTFFILQSNALVSLSPAIPSSGMIIYDAPAFGWLHTDGRWIKDEAGNVVLLRGVGRGETSYVFGPAYQGWYKHHEVERDYDKLKSLGVNVVRLTLNKYYWENHKTLPNIDGVVNEYVSLVDSIVSWCATRDIYIVLEYVYDIDNTADWSQSVKAEKIFVNPTGWINWWVEVVDRYKDQPRVMINPLNEPPSANYQPAPYNSKEACSARWREVVSQLIEAVRAVNPNIVIFIDPAGFDLMYDFSRKHLPYRNIVYCMHIYYHSALGSIVGHPWNPWPWAELYWNGQLTQAKQEFESFLLNYGFNLLDEKIPVYVSEFGVWVPDQNWDVQIRDFYDLCEKYGANWMQWWWHGHWSSEPPSGYDTIDYHLLKNDWTTLTVIGEELANYLAHT